MQNKTSTPHAQLMAACHQSCHPNGNRKRFFDRIYLHLITTIIQSHMLTGLQMCQYARYSIYKKYETHFEISTVVDVSTVYRHCSNECLFLVGSLTLPLLATRMNSIHQKINSPPWAV